MASELRKWWSTSFVIKKLHIRTASSQSCMLGAWKPALITSKKLNNVKNQLFLDMSEKWGHRANCFSKSWRGRQVDRTAAFQSKNKGAEVSVGFNTRAGKSELKNCWTISDNKFVSLKLHGGAPHFSFISCSSSSFPRWILEKYSLWFPTNQSKVTTLKVTTGKVTKWESNHFEICQSIPFLLTRPTLKRNYFTTAYWGLVRDLLI